MGTAKVPRDPLGEEGEMRRFNALAAYALFLGFTTLLFLSTSAHALIRDPN
jgi:hypothetical protein